MAHVTRREQITVSIMEPWTDGSYHPGGVTKYAWRCDGCGLVWPMRWQARECEGRGHTPTLLQRGYTRQALRQEEVA